MPPLHIANRLPQQVAADFTDILHYLRVARNGTQVRPNEKQSSAMGGT